MLGSDLVGILPVLSSQIAGMRRFPMRQPCGPMLALASITLANAHMTLPARSGPAAARLASQSRSAMKRLRQEARMVAGTESRFITSNVGNNVTPYIANLVGRDLHRTADHPLGIIKAKIEESRTAGP